MPPGRQATGRHYFRGRCPAGQRRLSSWLIGVVVQTFAG
jgi:hypothetical protein